MTPRRDLDAAGILDPALRAGYELCRRSNARNGRTYYLATLLLPPEKRPHVHALYGFARHADDIVDSMDPALGRLARSEQFTLWSEDFLNDLDWGSTSDPVWRAVIHTIERYDLPHRYFADFLESMRMDLTVTSYATYEDLTGYMWGSAGVIGLEMLPVLDRADKAIEWDEIEPYAVDLGYAFQLTNFVRDVGEDLARGRVYLPQESLRTFGVDRTRLARGVVDEPIRNLLAFEIERARKLYRSAERGVPMVHPTSRDCLTLAIELYSRILDEIEAADYDVFTRRISVGLPRRLRAAAPALRSSVLARRAVRGGRATPMSRA